MPPSRRRKHQEWIYPGFRVKTELQKQSRIKTLGKKIREDEQKWEGWDLGGIVEEEDLAKIDLQEDETEQKDKEMSGFEQDGFVYLRFACCSRFSPATLFCSVLFIPLVFFA